MYQVRIICVGKTKDKWLATAIEEYMKRLRAYAHVGWVYVKEGHGKGEHSQSHAVRIAAESKAVLKQIKPNSVCILCDISGDPLNNTALAEHFEQWAQQGQSGLDFVIGGAFGVAPAVQQRANLRLCLSQLTFTHQLTRLILIEQVYRTLSIIAEHKYHH